MIKDDSISSSLVKQFCSLDVTLSSLMFPEKEKDVMDLKQMIFLFIYEMCFQSYI